MARQARLELTTARLEGGCSIQLSYWHRKGVILTHLIPFCPKNHRKIQINVVSEQRDSNAPQIDFSIGTTHPGLHVGLVRQDQWRLVLL